MFGSILKKQTKPRAPYRRLVDGVQTLESRQCCALAEAIPALVGPAIAGQAAAKTQATQIGEKRWQSSGSPTIQDLRGVVNDDGVVHIVGIDGGTGILKIGQRQLYSIATDQMGAGQSFTSLLAGQGSNIVVNAELLSDGRVLYMGDSEDKPDVPIPAFWLEPNQPVNASPTATSGIVSAASPSGILGGVVNNPAAQGSLTMAMKNLPGAPGGTSILDITADGQYLVGDLIYKRNSSGDYIRVDTSTWEKPPDALEVPTLFRKAGQIGSTHYAAATYDIVTEDFQFTTSVVIYNLDTGKVVCKTKTGDILSDFDDAEGNSIILGVNDGNATTSRGSLYVLTADGLGQRVDLSAKLGVGAQIVFNGFFTQQELGIMFRTSAGEVKLAMLELISTPVDTRTQLTTTIQPRSAWLNDPHYFGNGLITVNMISTTGFDLGQLKRTDFTISSKSVSGKATPIAILAHHINRDRVKDVTLIFRMSDLRRNKVVAAPRYGETLTTDLIISGTSKEGRPFYGQVSLTFDSLSSVQRRVWNRFGAGRKR